jgi:hypothetical protein
MKMFKYLALSALTFVGIGSMLTTMTACTTDPETVVVIETLTVVHPFDSVSCLTKLGAGKYALDLDQTTNCDLPGDSTYWLDGLTQVKSGATLTIGAGATIKGKFPGLSALIIEKGGKIQAVGTAAKPIVFTSGRAAAQRGDFGGVIILGNGIMNSTTGSADVEGLVGVPYGGTNNLDNSGEMKYVRIEYAGYLLSVNNELNGLTMAGVGSGTQVSYVEVYEGFDDGFEWFGGAVSPHHLVVMGCDDDMFDWDFGWVGSAQFLLGMHNLSLNNDANGIEADNRSDNENGFPRSNPKIANVTLIGNSVPTGSGNGSLNGMRLRRGTAGTIVNALVTGFKQGRAVRIDGNNSIRLALATSDSLKAQAIYAYNNGGKTSFNPTAGLTESVATMASLATRVSAWFTTDTSTAGININVWKPTTSLAGAVTVPAGMTAATYIGALDPAVADSVQWTAGGWVRKFN